MQIRHALGRRLFALCLVSLLLTSCTGIPEGVQPVAGFELDRYLGTWYEIARLDHSFERGLTDVSAAYSRRQDGGVDVLNRGYDAAKGQWKEALGRAYFLGSPDATGEGRLRHNAATAKRIRWRYSSLRCSAAKASVIATISSNLACMVLGTFSDFVAGISNTRGGAERQPASDGKLPDAEGASDAGKA